MSYAKVVEGLAFYSGFLGFYLGLEGWPPQSCLSVLIYIAQDFITMDDGAPDSHFKDSNALV